MAINKPNSIQVPVSQIRILLDIHSDWSNSVQVCVSPYLNMLFSTEKAIVQNVSGSVRMSHQPDTSNVGIFNPITVMEAMILKALILVGEVSL